MKNTPIRTWGAIEYPTYLRIIVCLVEPSFTIVRTLNIY
ncbi:Uncharacterised protein [Legionella moravica]|uniref:Uncharacterized protein n=1 Tax=Legionella moravica TaxID=39962 RepID=A0A378JSV9_9GAMM|nr:Uncharacterised protein [Legionella moravica]